MPQRIKRTQNLLGLWLPLFAVVLILSADYLESPKTAYVGVLACVPSLAAVFGTMRSVVIVAILTWLSAFGFGTIASDGNVPAQTTRLIIIAIVSVLAVSIARLRIRNENLVQQINFDLAQAQALGEYSTTDYQTGLLNRLGLETQARIFAGTSPTMVLFDVDRLKSINDLEGHQIGDEYIKGVAGRIASCLKHTDVFGRWGGDEFVAVIDANPQQAKEIVDRIFTETMAAPIKTSHSSIPVRFSAGYTIWKPNQSFEIAFGQADKAMYEAKARGGSVSVNYSEISQEAQAQ